jgi:cellulose biosynthesis protein BcsQ
MSRPFRVVTFASNKGGVGKTTVAVNLAVLLRALHPELPVLVVGLDDQDLIDRMFATGDAAVGPDVAAALRAGDLGPALRLGRFGVHYVPTSAEASALKRELTHPRALAEALAKTEWRGLVLIDTKSDLEALTQNALWASDLAVLPVTDSTSLREAEKAFRLLESWGRSRARARVLLSLVDLRIKYAGGGHPDVLSLLVAEIRARGLPLLESFLSRSPRIEALATNADGPLPVSEAARDSLVHTQLRHLTQELLRVLAEAKPVATPGHERRQAARHAAPLRWTAFPERGRPWLQLDGRDLSRSGVGAVTAPGLELGERLHLAIPRSDGSPLLVWARVVRAAPGAALAFEAVPPETTAALEALLAPVQSLGGSAS